MAGPSWTSYGSGYSMRPDARWSVSRTLAKNLTIRHLNTEWIKAHATVSEALTFGVWFVLLYLFSFPLLHWFTSLAIIAVGSRIPIPSRSDTLYTHTIRNSISLTELRDFAVQNNNAVAYKLYEDSITKHDKDERDMIYLKESCFAILVLVVDCNRNGLGLQSAHFPDYIRCIYRPPQDHIICL
jgi:hypothetical protein